MFVPINRFVLLMPSYAGFRVRLGVELTVSPLNGRPANAEFRLSATCTLWSATVPRLVTAKLNVTVCLPSPWLTIDDAALDIPIFGRVLLTGTSTSADVTSLM